MISQTILLLAVLLDQIIGELKRWHPLVGFGRWAQFIERRLNSPRAPSEPQIITRFKGIIALAFTCLPFVVLAYDLASINYVGPLFSVFMLYLAIGAKSLEEHALAVAGALRSGDLDCARAQVSLMVSRETFSMQATDVRRAAIESVLENGNDAIFATIFWYMLAGPAGAVLHRLVNTLDAMWGYKTPQYLYFGWAAARLDDLLNWVPARLTALTYTLLGNWRCAFQCWQKQAPTWYSPNAGPVLATGAGALEIELGGAAIYHGRWKERPLLGVKQAPQVGDIERSLVLIRKGLWLWVLLACAGGFIHA